MNVPGHSRLIGMHLQLLGIRHPSMCTLTKYSYFSVSILCVPTIPPPTRVVTRKQIHLWRIDTKQYVCLVFFRRRTRLDRFLMQKDHCSLPSADQARASVNSKATLPFARVIVVSASISIYLFRFFFFISVCVLPKKATASFRPMRGAHTPDRRN